MHRTLRLVRQAAVPALPLACALPAAQAQIVYTNPPDVTQPVAIGAIYFDLNLDGGGSPVRTSSFAGVDFLMYLTAANGAHPYFLTNQPSQPSAVAGTSVSFNSQLFNLTAGATIGPGLVFSSIGGDINDSGSNNGQWPAGTTGYLGLRIGNPGNYHYGWAQISYNADLSLTLYDFAYESALNTPTIAGAIPEPATTGMLAGLGVLLAGSAARFRRRRPPRAGADVAGA